MSAVSQETPTGVETHLLVTPDGRAVERDQPFLRADDLGVLRGDGIFEAFLVADGQSDHLDAHLSRLERSAAMTGLAPPPAHDWRRAVDAAIAAWPGGREFVVRLIVTRGAERGAEATAYLLADPVNPAIMAQRMGGISALTLDRGLDPALAARAPWLLMGAKTISYAVNMAAQRWCRDHGAGDAIFVAANGVVLEGTTSAVVVARDGRLLSPPPSLGILASISLDGLFASAPAAGWEVGFEELTVADLHDADAVWLVSSVRLLARVHTLDGTVLADNNLHPGIAALVGPPGAGR